MGHARNVLAGRRGIDPEVLTHLSRALVAHAFNLDPLLAKRLFSDVSSVAPDELPCVDSRSFFAALRPPTSGPIRSHLGLDGCNLQVALDPEITFHGAVPALRIAPGESKRIDVELSGRSERLRVARLWTDALPFEKRPKHARGSLNIGVASTEWPCREVLKISATRHNLRVELHGGAFVRGWAEDLLRYFVAPAALGGWKCTRLHLALDLEFDPASVLIFDRGRKASGVAAHRRVASYYASELEAGTLYLGSRRSSCQIAVYDKLLDVRDRRSARLPPHAKDWPHVLRVEFRIRPTTLASGTSALRRRLLDQIQRRAAGLGVASLSVAGPVDARHLALALAKYFGFGGTSIGASVPEAQVFGDMLAARLSETGVIAEPQEFVTAALEDIHRNLRELDRQAPFDIREQVRRHTGHAMSALASVFEAAGAPPVLADRVARTA